MNAAFIRELSQRVRLDAREVAVLSAAGVRSYASLYNLVTAFPSVADAGLNLAKLSSVAARELPAMVAALSQTAPPTSIPPSVLGAMHPAGAPTPPGAVIQIGGSAASPSYTFGATAPGVGAPAANSPPPPVFGGSIDVRPSGRWPVKDQGNRGTCVAFAVTACGEFICASGTLSEQYLYWATKTMTADPAPAADGTHLRFARDALSGHGVCDDVLWPYAGVANPANITYAAPPHAPSAAAKANALGNRLVTMVPASLPAGTAAQALWNALDAKKSPVAISLPVIRSPGSATHNWNSPLAMLTGEVADPFATGLCIGGHAVCVTGFVPDPMESMGGYFVIRNSWGGRWGTSLPAAGYVGPEVGYGQVSASYVNDYLWEMCHL